MPKHLGPLEIVCDAPPYPIVQACPRIGVRRAEDVRWIRVDGNATCSCGRPRPILEKSTFTYATGLETSYFIGQCQKCLTVYWDNFC